MDCFHYPLDTETLLRKKRKLRRELLARNPHPLHKKIAILGGSTTNEVADQLGLFLLQYGIEAEFYQSEYAQYWQDAMFGTPELDDFHPDVIYIHTNWRNLTALPTTADSEAAIDAMLDEQYAHFETMWQALEQKFACPVIQNNFDRPNFRLMGNHESYFRSFTRVGTGSPPTGGETMDSSRRPASRTSRLPRPSSSLMAA